MEIKTKTANQLERHFKGAANHHRIDILLLVSENPNITVYGITEKLNRNFKTISEHTRRLVQAGLLNKNHNGRTVTQSLSPYGERFVKFITTFQHS